MTSPPTSRGKRKLFRLSLRVRLMIIGVTGLAIALAAASITLDVVLNVAINTTLDNEARSSAGEVAALVDKGKPPDPLPVSGAQVIQIIDSAHRVVDGSVTADRLTPLLHADELERALASAVEVSGSRAGVNGPLRVVAETAGPGNAQMTVLVAQQISGIAESIQALRVALWIAGPLLLILLAVIAWYVIGWTLRPVETLRRGAERISGGVRAERLPVPDADDEISALAITLNQMLDRLAAARGRQRAFVSDAAHELRSPLASIRVQLEVAQRVGTPAAVDDLLIDLDRLSTLVEDLLLLARADADTRGPSKPTVFDAQALIAEIAIDYSRPQLAVFATTGSVLAVTADRAEIRRAVGNLVDNAVRHAHTYVRLELSADPNTVTIHVLDDGPGIPENDRRRVFDRFTRLDTARDTAGGGTGLGLSIVEELSRRSGGAVTLADNPNGPGLDARLALAAANPRHTNDSHPADDSGGRQTTSGPDS